MSSRTNSINHRKSDVGIDNAVEKVMVKADAKRRQTIADISTKENATTISSNTVSKSIAIEPKEQRSLVSSPLKHHHAPVALGAAASHYFKGLPQTPVQKMIRSEQQKLLLQASMQVEDEEKTETLLANQSYLSSSSSSGGRNSSREDTDVLNTSVLSDTTELTASNYLVLAATHRTTAEDLRKIAEQRRQPLSTISITGKEDESVTVSAHGLRRQSVSEGIAIDSLSNKKNKDPRRRETMAIIPIPRSAPSPSDASVMVLKAQRSQQRERNKVADYQRRLSESSAASNGGTSVSSRRQGSIAPKRGTDGIAELSFSSNDMKKLPDMSIIENASLDTNKQEPKSESVHEETNEFISPPRNTRSSTASVSTGKGSSKKSPSSKIDRNVDINALSPARNTRSAAKKATTNNTLFEEKSLDTFQSPSRSSRRGTPKKSTPSSSSVPTLTSRIHLSPAKSTRSATKRLNELLVNQAIKNNDLSMTIDKAAIEDDLENGLNQSIDLVSGNSTASIGDLLDNVIADDIRLDTSVTPTARNTRSAQKERTQSISMDVKALASSPAQNTRSAQRRKSIASPGRDDTAQLLLDLAAGGFQAPIDKVDAESFAQKTADPIADPATISDVDILNELVEKYSAHKSPVRYGDTSQESTISLNDLLSEYMPQSQKHPSGDLGEEGNKSSASSLNVQSAISKASTIDTPQGMSDYDHYDGLNMSTVPNSPPSTIRFTANDDSFMGRTTIIGQSALRKALTPSRLKASPRRFITSSNKNRSPFKSAVTPTRLSASPYRLFNPMTSTENQNASLTPSKLHISPSRPKRSIESIHPDTKELTSAMKRQKTFDKLQDLAKDSLVTKEILPPPSTSRNGNLLSALRRPGQGSVGSSMKRVAFVSSPTFAEFNKNSPAENVTPMIIRRPYYSDKMVDDTAEIEIDMQSLMESNKLNIDGAGRTPGVVTRKFKQMDSIDDSNMSVDSQTIFDATNEPTMTLESNIYALLQDEPSVAALKVQETHCTEENTIELETDINALLHDPTLAGEEPSAASKSEEIECTEENTIELETDINALLHDPASSHEEPFNHGRRSLVFDDEPTWELESDINSILPDGNCDTNEHSPHASRRFSIAPSRRLSISLDGCFDHAKVEDSAVVAIPRNQKINVSEAPTQATLDLKVGEIVDFATIQSFSLNKENDFLHDVEYSMRENCISDTMAAFTAQVLQMIESQTEAIIEPNSAFEMSNGDDTFYLAVQSHFRDEITKEMFKKSLLASSLYESDKFEWLLWLVSATEQLGRPLTDKSIGLADEIKRLDKLCIDAEKCLALVTTKSVQKERKKSTNRRMSEIVSLENDIVSIEAEIHRLNGYVKEKSDEACILSSTVETIEDNISLSTSLHDEEKLAKVYEQKCNTLKGAVKCKPMVLDHTEFSFKYLGSTSKTCVALSFFVSSQDFVSITAKVDPTLFDKGGIRDASTISFVSQFLQVRMQHLCEMMSQQVLNSTCDIPSCLRRFEHLVGRLEGTAAEFIKLQERYRGKISLSRIANSASFHVKIRFQSQIAMPLLVASFEVSDIYPFSPLNVCLDSYDTKMNVEAIQKSMVKNAKPGFGYLSRLCDVVEVSLD